MSEANFLTKKNPSCNEKEREKEEGRDGGRGREEEKKQTVEKPENKIDKCHKEVFALSPRFPHQSPLTFFVGAFQCVCAFLL